MEWNLIPPLSSQSGGTQTLLSVYSRTIFNVTQTVAHVLVVVLLNSNTVSGFISHSFFIYVSFLYLIVLCDVVTPRKTQIAITHSELNIYLCANLNMCVQLFIAQNIQFMLHRRFLVEHIILFITVHLFQTFTLIIKFITANMLLKRLFETFLMSPLISITDFKLFMWSSLH